MSPDPVPAGDASHAEHADESAVVARVRTGDRAAFDILMDAHAEALLRIAYGYVKSRADAEDLVQDLFLRIWESRATWQPHGSIGSYLAVAVRRRALNLLKHRRVEAIYSGTAAAEGDHATATADVTLIANDDRAALHAVLDRLSDRARLVLLLRYEQKRSFAEVAEILGISVPAAWQLVARAIAQARALMEL